MSQKLLVSYGDAGGNVPADTTAQPNTVVYRDNQGGIAAAQVLGTELKSSGILTLTSAAKSALFTADGAATLYLCDATSAAFVVTLPAASSCAGRNYVFKKVDSAAHNVTVTAAGADTIDGAATKVLSSQYQSTRIQSDGTNWWIV